MKILLRLFVYLPAICEACCTDERNTKVHTASASLLRFPDRCAFHSVQLQLRRLQNARRFLAHLNVYHISKGIDHPESWFISSFAGIEFHESSFGDSRFQRAFIAICNS